MNNQVHTNCAGRCFGTCPGELRRLYMACGKTEVDLARDSKDPAFRARMNITAKNAARGRKAVGARVGAKRRAELAAAAKASTNKPRRTRTTKKETAA